MTDQDRERVIDALAKRRLPPEEVLLDAGTQPADSAELRAMARTSELLWLSEHEAPPLHSDPVAAMLGLVPDTNCTLDPRAFARARKAAGLKPSGIASRLRQKGWRTTDADVFRWETRSANDVPPAVVQALAEILGKPVEQLTRAHSVTEDVSPLEAIRRTPAFQALVDRWARARHVSLPVASAALEGRLAATVYRGDTPDAARMLESLDALVSAVETSSE